MWSRLLSIALVLSAWPAAARVYHTGAERTYLNSSALWASSRPHASYGVTTEELSGQSGRQTRSRDGKNTESPLDLDQIRDLIGILSDVALAETIKNRGINFKPDVLLLASLQREGVGQHTLEVLRGFLSNRAPEVSLRLSAKEIARGQDLILTAEAAD